MCISHRINLVACFTIPIIQYLDPLILCDTCPLLSRHSTARRLCKFWTKVLITIVIKVAILSFKMFGIYIFYGNFKDLNVLRNIITFWGINEVECIIVYEIFELSFEFSNGNRHHLAIYSTAILYRLAFFLNLATVTPLRTFLCGIIIFCCFLT